MLNSKTVFVVGAGASHEVDLPTGGALKRIIYDKVDFRGQGGRLDPNYGDVFIYEWIRHHHRDKFNNYIDACRRLRAGVLASSSIDDFLDAHRDDAEMVECGKVVIARAILETEKSSPLAVDTSNIYNTMNLARLENAWYMNFFRLLSVGLNRSHRAEIFRNATVVCFNYDRCIEHFLVHVLKAHYHIKHDEACELTRHLPVFRPYGSVGDYLGAVESVPFGHTELQHVARVSTKNIRTYSEQADDKSLDEMRAAVRDASVLVFLGNAFHETNMKLITPNDATPVRKRVYFTRKGVSDSDLEVVERQLIRLSGNTKKHVPAPRSDYRYTDTVLQVI